ncbi:MAG: hypothetical protein methR_P1366 [Methyloprofundus sp.]|nr:MAG: hypothetical protein methR_P1366 [Methyloprofundus sp.]
MKLLRLRSTNQKFKTLEFNEGLSIVAGLQKTDDTKESINSIGKSLSLKMVHFMLGASFNSKEDKKLKDYLSSYGLFYLELEHNDKEYIIEKDFNNSKYYINNEKINSKEYREKLNEIFSQQNSKISFRQLLNCFARRYGETYYTNSLTQQGRPLEDYQQRFINLLLLGVDTSLVEEKYQVKEKLSKLESASKAIKGYEKELDKNNLKDLQDEINNLINKKENFIIAESYGELKKQADKLTSTINELRNNRFFLEQRLEKKDGILKDSGNINIDIGQIESIYNEAKFFFEKDVYKRLKDAQCFHNSLIENRKNRLFSETKELRLKIKEVSNNIKINSTQRDYILKDLDDKGALEEYNSITERIKTLELEVQHLKKYETILHDFKKDKSKLTIQNTQITEKSILYLEAQKNYLDVLEDKFRNIVKRFYDNHGGSLKIKDTKDAKYLFDILANIPKDAGQAVGEVKLFCYDILLYQLNKDLLSFMAHDGCIFSEMDSRQKSTILKIILELTKENDLQYFLNIGQNTLNEILDSEDKINILSSEEKKRVKGAVILELYDKNSENWLFGESFS